MPPPRRLPAGKNLCFPLLVLFSTAIHLTMVRLTAKIRSHSEYEG